MDQAVERIYNTYLRISRTRLGKPFKYRKDFKGFETDKNYLPAIKLKSFFSRNPQIKMEDFFIAPYEVFEKEKEAFYDLNFYNSLQAVKVYSIFNKRSLLNDPDSSEQLEKIKEGIMFIKDFCIKNNFTLDRYLTFKSQKVHDFLVHLVEKKIVLYNLFPLKNFDAILREYDYEMLSFILNDLAPRISYFRTKFLASKKAKIFSFQGLKKIDEALKKSLKTENV